MMSNIFDRGLPYAIALLRIVAAWRLWDGTWPYVSRLNPMEEIISFFDSLRLPFPEVAAYVSLYAQFLGAILLFVGWQTRIISFILVINFSVALLAAHLHDPISKSFAAWALWALTLFFLFNGAGKISLDSVREKLNKSSKKHL